MKHALTAPPFLLAALALDLNVRPAAADYDACMTFCLDEHSFSYCYPVCDGSASNAGAAGDTDDAGGAESAVPAFTAKSCGAFDEIDADIGVETGVATWTWITERHGAKGSITGSLSPLDDEESVVEVSFAICDTNER